jgi:hypothetical protein
MISRVAPVAKVKAAAKLDLLKILGRGNRRRVDVIAPHGTHP